MAISVPAAVAARHARLEAEVVAGVREARSLVLIPSALTRAAVLTYAPPPKRIGRSNHRPASRMADLSPRGMATQRGPAFAKPLSALVAWPRSGLVDDDAPILRSADAGACIHRTRVPHADDVKRPTAETRELRHGDTSPFPGHTMLTHVAVITKGLSVDQ